MCNVLRAVLYLNHCLREIASEWRNRGVAVNYVLRNQKTSWTLPLTERICRAHVVLNLLWHFNLPIIWLTASVLPCHFPLWWPCPSVKAHQLPFGLAACTNPMDALCGRVCLNDSSTKNVCCTLTSTWGGGVHPACVIGWNKYEGHGFLWIHDSV